MKLSFLSFAAIVACVCCPLLASAQVASRLVAQSDSTVQSVYFDAEKDSSALVYSLGRGGDLKSERKATGMFDGLNYDSLFSYSSLKGSGMTLMAKMLQRFTGPNLTDAFFLFQDSGSFKNYASAHAVYNSRNDMIKYFSYSYTGSAWGIDYIDTNTYDARHNLLTSVEQTWGKGKWHNSYKDSMAYDASNNLLMERTYGWDSVKNDWVASGQNLNTYSGSLITQYLFQSIDTNGNAQNSMKQSYSYNSKGKMIKQVSEEWIPRLSSWFTEKIDSTVYNSTDDTSVSYSMQFYAGSVPATNLRRHINVYDTHGNTLFALSQLYDSVHTVFINTARGTYTYNSFDQLSSETYELAGPAGSWLPDTNIIYQSHYYYETYTPASVSSLEAEQGILKIFPNPASSTININIKWHEPQSFTIAIYNMQGRLIQQWGEQKTDVYEKQIPVSMLSAGNYVIKVRGEQGQLQEQLSIVH